MENPNMVTEARNKKTARSDSMTTAPSGALLGIKGRPASLVHVPSAVPPAVSIDAEYKVLVTMVHP